LMDPNREVPRDVPEEGFPNLLAMGLSRNV